MKQHSLFRVITIILMVSCYSLFGQSSVGKLVGKITDAATKEALIGANVSLLGTGQGAATDAEGQYLVLNIVPGNYDVQFSYIGYGKKIIKDVRIVAGITFDLNVELASNVTLDEVVISGKKLFEEKATNTVKVFDASQIDKLPVKGVEKIAGMQAGVVMQEGSGGASGNANINVRGGRNGEVLYVVDGVAQNDAYYGTNMAQVSAGAIDQVAFQIGGFDAKYGQAQSGVVNITTKSGTTKYTVATDLLTSSFTDDYGYNLYSVNVGGPIIPSIKDHTIFLSAERGYFLATNPTAKGLVIPSIGLDTKVLPSNQSDIWRFSGRTYHNLSPVSVRLGANVNFRNTRSLPAVGIPDYRWKNSSDNITRNKFENYSYTARVSHNINANSFWDLNLGYKIFNRKSGDGVFFDDLEKYGDTLYNRYMTSQGATSKTDMGGGGLYWAKGTIVNGYTRDHNASITLDMNYTNQLSKHLLEVGFGAQFHTLRHYFIAPRDIAKYIRPNGHDTVLTRQERYATQNPQFWGFDVYGQDYADGDTYASYSGDQYPITVAPKKPVSLSGYIQDKFELNDLVINVGVRMDYYNADVMEVANMEYPNGTGGAVNKFDLSDLKKKDPEWYISPRIGLGFPVTSSTVFHAQYGKFIQEPTLFDVYSDMNTLRQFDNTSAIQGVNTGNLNSEITTQYEIGFRQIVGDNLGALNITAFYKNTKDLIDQVNFFFYPEPGGPRYRGYGPANTDFGTVRGFAFALQMNKLSYFSFDMEYTYSLAEGTGSSTTTSQNAAFRSETGETPKVISPLNFDQRHTGVINLDFTIPQGEMGYLGGLSANLIFTFNSGRPYTPLKSYDVARDGAASANSTETKGYVNSSYMPGSSRFDFKIEKQFKFGDMMLIPYLTVENLFNAENVVWVYPSTGSASSSGFLNTDAGAKKAASGLEKGEGWVTDYNSLEQNPLNYGIPRLIKLGLRINFAGFSL